MYDFNNFFKHIRIEKDAAKKSATVYLLYILDEEDGGGDTIYASVTLADRAGTMGRPETFDI